MAVTTVLLQSSSRVNR